MATPVDGDLGHNLAHGYVNQLGTVSGGYAQAVANQASITAAVDLTSLTVTFTAVTGRRYKVSGYVQANQGGSAANVIVYIMEGATQLQLAEEGIAATGYHTFTPQRIITGLSAGSHTFKLQMFASASCSALAAATNPNWIMVEDVGV